MPSKLPKPKLDKKPALMTKYLNGIRDLDASQLRHCARVCFGEEKEEEGEGEGETKAGNPPPAAVESQQQQASMSIDADVVAAWSSAETTVAECKAIVQSLPLHFHARFFRYLLNILSSATVERLGKDTLMTNIALLYAPVSTTIRNFLLFYMLDFHFHWNDRSRHPFARVFVELLLRVCLTPVPDESGGLLDRTRLLELRALLAIITSTALKTRVDGICHEEFFAREHRFDSDSAFWSDVNAVATAAAAGAAVRPKLKPQLHRHAAILLAEFWARGLMHPGCVPMLEASCNMAPTPFTTSQLATILLYVGNEGAAGAVANEAALRTYATMVRSLRCLYVPRGAATALERSGESTLAPRFVMLALHRGTGLPFEACRLVREFLGPTKVSFFVLSRLQLLFDLFDAHTCLAADTNVCHRALQRIANALAIL